MKNLIKLGIILFSYYFSNLEINSSLNSDVIYEKPLNQSYYTINENTHNVFFFIKNNRNSGPIIWQEILSMDNNAYEINMDQENNCYRQQKFYKNNQIIKYEKVLYYCIKFCSNEDLKIDLYFKKSNHNKPKMVIIDGSNASKNITPFYGVLLLDLLGYSIKKKISII